MAGIKFSSIESVKFLDDMTTIRIRQITPDVPNLKEVRKGHYVSCLLYNEPIEKRQEEVIENASAEASTD